MPASSGVQQELERLRARVKELEAFETKVSHFPLLSEQVPAILWATDRQLRITSITGSGLRRMGMSPNDIAGMSVGQVLGVTDPEASPHPEHRTAIAGQTVLYDYPWRDRIFRCQLDPLHDAAGAIIGTVGIGIDITEHVELEQALRHRVAAESLLTSISTEFISMKPEEISGGIDDALQRVGRFAEADRAYVFSVSDDGRWCSNTHEWCAEGIESVIDQLQNHDLERMPWWKGHLERLETIFIPDVASLPDQAGQERIALEAQGIRSLLAMPLAAGRRLIGFLGFDAVRAHKLWTPEDVKLLRACGEAIAGAMQRSITEQELHESEAVNRSIIEAIPDMVFRVHRDGRFLTCNAKDPSRLAISAEALIGNRLRDLGLHDVDEMYMQAISRALDTGTVSQFEYHAPPERGGRYWEVRVAQCGRDEVIAIVRDVTDRRQAELDIRERDRFLSSLISNIPGCVYRCRNDREWTMQFVSEGIAEMVGYSTEQLLSGEQSIGNITHADDRQRVWDEVQAALNARRDFQMSYRVIAANGETKWLLERGGGVYGSDGSLKAIEGFVTDITELKQAEQSLKQSHSVLRLTLSEMDHRVRNNLASIAALMDMTARRHKSLDAFKEAVKARVQSMASVHSMLSRNRWLPSRLDEVLATVLPDEIDATVDAQGPKVHLAPRQGTALGMVLHELIANSLKYGALSEREGRLDVRWECRDIDDNLQRVELKWKENCGQAVAPVSKAGLGTELIEGIVRNDLGGHVQLSYPKSGANHKLVLKIERSDSGANR